MKTNQLTRGFSRRVMYVENKTGYIDGVEARIGWVQFSKSGRTVYYRGRALKRLKGTGISGNHFDAETGEEYWVSGIKREGSNTHPGEVTSVAIDNDAWYELHRIKNAAGV